MPEHKFGLSKIGLPRSYFSAFGGKELLKSVPFKIKTIQTDNGIESPYPMDPEENSIHHKPY
jgi:hypothetical protein